METNSIIKLEHLSHIYNYGLPFEKRAVDDVTLSIPEGAFIGVIGHTGSGKSTLIQHLNGLLKPTLGKVYFDGRDIWTDKQYMISVKFQVGLVFQYPEYQLFEETVYKDIAFGPSNMGLTKDEIHERISYAAGFTGLSEEHLMKSPFELSGGQKRRAAIAGVIAMRPRVLILDEPTAGLDPKGRDKILGQMREYHRQTRSTVILVSHSMEDIAKNTDIVLVMNKSKIAMLDTTRNVFERHDELEAMGLTVPQITKVFMKLREKGVYSGEPVYTVKYGVQELKRLLGGDRS